MKLVSENPLEEVRQLVFDDVSPFFKEKYPNATIPLPNVSGKVSDSADFSIMCAKFGTKPLNEFTSKLAEEVNEYLKEHKGKIVKSASSFGVHLNFGVDRAIVLKLAVENIMQRGLKYGHVSLMKGKKAIVEHTSTNPNSPLHIGNLRNVIVGAHLARLLSAVGYDVQERFLVNDLGAQISLTVLGFDKIYDGKKPNIKMDQWIGRIYAVMNTLKELQKWGGDLVEIRDAIKEEADVEPYVAKVTKEKSLSEESEKNLKEYINILLDLLSRFAELVHQLIEAMRDVPSIQDASGKLGLEYERCVPETVRKFRRLVMATLKGQQETLDIYRVRHSAWDFESELVWDKSVESALEAMKNSPYFHAQTEKEGAYIEMKDYIEDKKLPVGKKAKGFAPDYPRLYVLRPDGSTLYYMRDIVYSVKKCQIADLVLNVICSEQALAQEKVALGMSILRPDLFERLYHFNYELVVLTTGKMSGRRGRYLLADDLYDDLKARITEKVSNRDGLSDEEFEGILHEVSTASMKYALLSTGARNKIHFDIEKVTSFEDASAPFLLYNATRFKSLFDKFADMRNDHPDRYPEDLKPLEACDFSYLNEPEYAGECDRLWSILITHVLKFPSLVTNAGCPVIPAHPQLPEFQTASVPQFLNYYVREFSSFYRAIRILDVTQSERTHCRLHAMKAYYQVVENALRLIIVEPLDRM